MVVAERTIWHQVNKTANTYRLEGLPEGIVTELIAVAVQILAQGTRKEHRILRNDGQTGPQAVEFQRLCVDAIDADAAIVVVQSEQRLDQR